MESMSKFQIQMMTFCLIFGMVRITIETGSLTGQEICIIIKLSSNSVQCSVNFEKVNKSHIIIYNKLNATIIMSNFSIRGKVRKLLLLFQVETQWDPQDAGPEDDGSKKAAKGAGKGGKGKGKKK